jgi:2-methylcitrate dehydratase PrpD
MADDPGLAGKDAASPQVSRAFVLARFAASLRHDMTPPEVFSRAEELFVDWAGSALAGARGSSVRIVTDFARAMGPGEGPSELLAARGSATPYFAAMVNAASSHLVEQDDVHNGSVFHPAAVVFPVALALAQARGASGRDMLLAAIAGYEVGIRIGEFLGRSHYRIFHTTGTVGTLAAAATAGHLLRLDAEKMLSAFGSAGTQAAGLWQFLRDAADSKQLHTAHAAAAGLASAWLAKGGFTAARDILEGDKGLAAGMSRDAAPACLTDRLGSRWALAETSFKFHASCRHTHPAADALAALMAEHRLAAERIAAVTVFTHQGAIDVLGAVDVPASVHQAKFSMGTVLGLIAHGGRADVEAFEHVLERDDVAAFRRRVTMVRDEEVDAAYPGRWIGKIAVETVDGHSLRARIEEPKGDPGNSLSRDEITAKVASLIGFGGLVPDKAIDPLVRRLWNVARSDRVPMLLA